MTYARKDIVYVTDGGLVHLVPLAVSGLVSGLTVCAYDARLGGSEVYRAPTCIVCLGLESIGPESDAALRLRISDAYGKWGSFLSVVIESSGSALDDCAAHMNLKRYGVD